MTTYEIFELLYGDFRDRYEEDKFIFTQKYVVGQQTVSVYSLKDKENLDVGTCLNFLNDLQERFAYHKSWTPFCFNYFDDTNGIRVFRFTCKNEDEKRMYELLCCYAIS